MTIGMSSMVVVYTLEWKSDLRQCFVAGGCKTLPARAFGRVLSTWPEVRFQEFYWLLKVSVDLPQKRVP